MWASVPTSSGGPEPAPPAAPLSGGGFDDHDHHDNSCDDDSSPLLDLLERFPDLFKKYVLERLDPTARASLAGAGSAFWDMAYPISMFPFGVPPAQMTDWVVLARVFKLVDFLGSIERLAWAKANGCPWTAGTCRYVARGGHLEALRWMRELGCPWDERTSYAAAAGGHLAVLQWARAHDCPWGEHTCYFAALGGHLSVLQWARAHGYPWRKRECEVASLAHPETLAWVRQQPE
jgi:hypothetical protein